MHLVTIKACDSTMELRKNELRLSFCIDGGETPHKFLKYMNEQSREVKENHLAQPPPWLIMYTFTMMETCLLIMTFKKKTFLQHKNTKEAFAGVQEHGKEGRLCSSIRRLLEEGLYLKLQQ